MNLLIDTHIVIWYIAGNPKLNSTMTDLLEPTENDISISVASLWEIAIKVGKGRLDLGIDFHELAGILDRLNIQILPILFDALNVYRTLPLHHADPFDRLIIAQSISQNLVLMSADSAFSDYPVQNIWSEL
ncbi:type II toxin-antitoxin system VapC family toxin [Chamaesiphon sp. VAR_69_metabat_338]|uniref:type II toxin-antitoxin system VapC family toxin n=1 Tax=Chamaesiphon sp. VAR_69_metabat_338 TaxID=2964704 RepID=UPI00286E8E3C|nr:type II toxin-antitoxin system VapC family toxin [Chamaesiphon sp. VAR_69_metabat_338]